MSEKTKNSQLVMWLSVWVAIYLPQFVLLARHWRGVVATLPLIGAGFLAIAEVVAGVALLAGICAAVAIWRAQARAEGMRA